MNLAISQIINDPPQTTVIPESSRIVQSTPEREVQKMLETTMRIDEQGKLDLLPTTLRRWYESERNMKAKEENAIRRTNEFHNSQMEGP